jgi:peptidoglycan/LPS O-acetylase OafA/YrhL
MGVRNNRRINVPAITALQEMRVAKTRETGIGDQRKDYIPQLDGLRAFAVAFVLVAHGLYSEIPSLKKYADFGHTGVLMFFVISGFLISRILIRSKNNPNYFFNFYARRGLRIWPLYYVVLALSFAFWRFGPPQPNVTGGIHVSTYLVYLQNLIYGHQPVPVGLAPTWTLAVEEQFYLAWPVLVYFSSRKTLRWLCLILIVVAPIARVSNVFDQWNTICQIDALALGSLLAFAGYDSNLWLKVSRYAVFLLPLGIYLQVCRIEWLARWLNGDLFQIYGGAALVYLTIQTHTLAASVFRRAALRYIGKISYGIYLFNVPVFCGLGYVLKGIRHSPSVTTHVFFLLVGSLLTIAAAAVSYSLFESPLLRLKKYFPESSKSAVETVAIQLTEQDNEAPLLPPTPRPA